MPPRVQHGVACRHHPHACTEGAPGRRGGSQRAGRRASRTLLDPPPPSPPTGWRKRHGEALSPTCPALLAAIRSLYPACPGAPSHAERSAGRPRKLKKGDAVRLRILRDPAMGLVLTAWAVATSIESQSTSDRADLCMNWANPGGELVVQSPDARLQWAQLLGTGRCPSSAGRWPPLRCRDSRRLV